MRGSRKFNGQSLGFCDSLVPLIYREPETQSAGNKKPAVAGRAQVLQKLRKY